MAYTRPPFKTCFAKGTVWVPMFDPTSIIFSLEGVFASIAAWLLLDQYLNEFKILGIIIILSAVIFSQLAPIYGKKIYGRN